MTTEQDGKLGRITSQCVSELCRSGDGKARINSACPGMCPRIQKKGRESDRWEMSWVSAGKSWIDKYGIPTFRKTKGLRPFCPQADQRKAVSLTALFHR